MRSTPRSMACLALCMGLAAPAAAQPAARPVMQVAVDATDLDHRVFSVQQTLPATPGPLRLQFPRWLPGTHAPGGQIGRLAGLQIEAGGQPLPWLRDPLDPYGFTLTVPRGVSALNIAFQFLSPTDAGGAAGGRVVMTPQMLNVQWHDLLLYPAGVPADALPVQATLRLPTGWQAATALRPAGDAPAADGRLRFAPVTLERLVDSPVFAGRHVRRIPLEPEGAARPVVLNLVADNAEVLAAPTEAQIDAHRRLVQQADKLFGARHFRQYDFLLALSERMSRIGLEHLESSENGVDLKYFEGWDKAAGARQLLPHEYTHSWNGKFRRPADLTTPDFTQPMQNSLLWVYEGQTEFWGRVLATRSGLTTPAMFRDELALSAASQDQRAGRRWRNLQDVTNDAVYARSRGSHEWPDYQRSSGEYYVEGTLIWLEADMLIRQQSGGQRSLDDFARAFFGVGDGQPGPLTYRFDDVVRTLAGVQPHDWTALLRQRLDQHDAAAPLDGLAAAGWRLAWSDTPSEATKAQEVRWKFTDFQWSLGLTLGPEGRLQSVRWDGPAFQAGLAPGMTVVAINLMAYSADRLKAAVRANREGQAPIELLVRDGDQFRQVRVDWRGGLRYPTLERLPDREDRLATLLAPR